MSAGVSNYGPQPSSGPKRLSCVTCRQRKVKCNKENPCNLCQKAGIQCVFPSRVRVPRTKQVGSKSRDLELLRRISRLENLVSKIDADGLIESHAGDVKEAGRMVDASTSASVLNDGPQGGDLDEKYASFIKEQETGTPYLSGEFWASLCGEVDGLRQLLEHSPDDEEEVDDGVLNSTETKYSPPNFILSDPATPSDSESAYPSDEHRSILFQVYFSNVDPVCKILHKPNSMTHLVGANSFLESSGRLKFASIEAITFAIYFAAVTTLTSGDCINQFGEEKETLIARYKHSTEVALSRAEFMNSMEIVTLQALTLYMMALRSHDKSRSSWTLIGLAVRIAHGLGIHRDGDGYTHSAFEAEMRRRLWWELVILDMKASEDRGSEPLIAENTFNTRMPCNLNDEDFGLQSKHPLPERKGLTDMTFFLICADLSNTARKINFVPPAKEHQPLTLQEKEELARQCAERIESDHLAGCDPNEPRHWLLYMLGRLLILKLGSAIQYPLQSRHARSLPPGQSLRTVTSLLEIIELVESHPSAQKFAWYFNTYVPWHTLAVALAELCHETRGPLAERAWRVVDGGYAKWSERVADSKGGMLWRPIRSLLKRAQAARRRALGEASVGAAAEGLVREPVVDLSFLQSRVVEQLPNLSLDPSVSQEAFSHPVMGVDQTPYPLFGVDCFSLTDMPLALPAADGFEGNPDWNEWNDFILGVHAVNPLIELDGFMDPMLQG